MNTFMANAQNVERKWYVVDADGMVLGRLATQVANILRGKTKPIYTPHVDTGDYVIIINADKAILTGRKLDQKIYYHHSGYTGGMSETKSCHHWYAAQGPPGSSDGEEAVRLCGRESSACRAEARNARTEQVTRKE